MMTQSVMTQATNLFGSATASVNTKSGQTSNGFDLVMGSSLAFSEKKNYFEKQSTVQANGYDKTNQTGRDNKASEIKETAKTSATKETNQMADSKETAKTDKSKASTGTTSKQADNLKSATKTDENRGQATKELTQEEQLTAQIQGMLQSIREVIMEILQISPGELDQLMSNIQVLQEGMSPADLLQSDALRQLVLAVSGETDLLTALTDEKLANTMKQLIQSVDQIKAETNLPLTEEQIKSFLEQTKVQVDEPLEQETKETVIMNNQNNAIKPNQDGLENKEQSKTDVGEQKDISLETTKLSDPKTDSTGSQSDYSKEESSEQKSTDQFQTFVDNMVSVSQTTQVDSTGNEQIITELRDVANQIIERIKIIVKPNQTSMELQLNPDHLGKVNLNVQSKNGIMTAQFVVQNDLTKDAIQSQMQSLRDTLNQQGIKVEAIEVTVSMHAFDQSNQTNQDDQQGEQKNQATRNISLEEAIAMSEVSEDENNIIDTDDLKGSQIDYIA